MAVAYRSTIARNHHILKLPNEYNNNFFPFFFCSRVTWVNEPINHIINGD
jgi:hypothetical protein